ncbi:MAG: aminoacyl-histidine dipeptidase [Clostridia bacterium]|nr:aminoacyl-histidine dipeptidase [Clostridia bacterium]
MLDLSDFKELGGFIRFFKEISRIPHGSGNTAAIADYLENFARDRKLFCYRDELNNVIIRADATPGYENRPAVILQGHTDMVAEKRSDCQKDMAVSGLDIYRDGDFLRADGTTLGGDDGVMVAYALALLDDKAIPHPTVECVFTSDEETGLVGATGLDTSVLSGRMMINIDSDEEGVLTVGCAGGVRADLSLPVFRENVKEGGYVMRIDGLVGGHSGIEIDKGRENAIKLIGEALADIGDARIASLSGGNADNAIPRSAEAVFLSDIPREELDAICECLRERYAVAEKDISVTLEPAECDSHLTRESSAAVLRLICDNPTGVIRMDEDLPELVETSLNMGIARLGEDAFLLSFSLRSSVNERKEELLRRVTDISESLGATVSTHGSYPGWKYRKDSPLRDIMCQVYKKRYGKEASVVTIHAGLECGIFSDKIPELDCVSIGPDNFDIHTPDEHLSIPSTLRVWEYLKEVLISL